MGAKKLNEVFRKHTERQLILSAHLNCTNDSYFERLKKAYERELGVSVWRYECLDAVIYIQNAGQHGFKAVKFYNDGIDFRIGSYQESESQALNEAIHLL